jgi:hypothetical protein
MRGTSIALMLVGPVVFALASVGRAAAIFDDFNDNALDATRFRVALPFADSAVVEQNQRLEFTNRGYLVTRDQFRPTAAAPVAVSGRVTFLNTGGRSEVELFQIATRTSGVPGANFFAEPSDGLWFGIVADHSGRDNVSIRTNINVPTIGDYGTLDLVDGDSVDFQLLDDGTNYSFTVVEVGDPASRASISGTSAAPVAAASVVALYNRESIGSLHLYQSALDDLRIAVVPEPSWLLPASTLALLARRPRRNG